MSREVVLATLRENPAPPLPTYGVLVIDGNYLVHEVVLDAFEAESLRQQLNQALGGDDD